ncbi:anhydro-N-acetylmuramic acid kinase [bacterium]|nr:anhydro-N-acetylmuramic acid kinase [bacterium]
MSSSRFFWALGAMSGTSLDGVDAAMVLTDGLTVKEFGKSGYRAYTDDERAILRAGFGQTHGAKVDAAASVIETAHIELLEDFPEAELIGFHGQTLTHAPEKQFTLQAGDGSTLARALDRKVVWDFRSTDVGMGGQGAPLAPFYHFALARRIGSQAPVGFANIGGVANLTWVDPNATAPEAPQACLAFDTGPGNALIDDLCQSRLGLRFDLDGALTQRGTVHEDILTDLLEHTRYFSKVPPKSLDRNDFASWADAVADLPSQDAIATLAAGTAASIVLGLTHCPRAPERLLITGGGRQNQGLMQMLAARAPCPVEPVEAFDLDGDMLEAQAFGYLAVRVLRGLATSGPGTTGVAANVSGGQISVPNREQSVS